MYFQVFTTNRQTQKQSQFSCDNWEEVTEVIEKKQPKFVKVEYYDCSGLVGVACKYFNFLSGVYVTYKKIKS